MVNRAIGYIILLFIAGMYLTPIIDDYRRVVRQQRMQGRELKTYLFMRIVRDTFVLTLIIVMFYVLSL